MKRHSRGVTLIEVIGAALVVSITLMSVVKLVSKTEKGLTLSMGNLQAQASAEELMATIRTMRWDKNSPLLGQMSLTGPNSPPSVSCTGPCPTPRTALEDWSDCSMMPDTNRPQFRLFRSVRVEFLRFNGTGRLVKSTNPTHMKGVTVWSVADGNNAVHPASASITSVFYNNLQ